MQPGVKVTVLGKEKVLLRLRKKHAQFGDGRTAVLVGFSANYAIFVHERTSIKHRVGQAKFLEEPARRLHPTLVRYVGQAIKRGLSLLQSLMFAGLRLQYEAQTLTPVATGFLRASAFTRPESELGGK